MPINCATACIMHYQHYALYSRRRKRKTLKINQWKEYDIKKHDTTKDVHVLLKHDKLTVEKLINLSLLPRGRIKRLPHLEPTSNNGDD